MNDISNHHPPSCVSALILVGRLFLRVFLGRRRFWGLALAACAPVGLVAYGRLAHAACGAGDLAELIAFVILQFLGLGLPLLLGVAAVRDDREDRTLIYLWTRPVDRWVLVLGKLLAASCLSGFLLLAATGASGALALIACEGQGAGGWAVLGRGLSAALLAGMVYTPLFALVAVMFTKPMIPAILLAFGWETVVANLPGAFPRVTLMYYLKSLLGLGPETAGVLSMFIESLNPASLTLSLLVLFAALLVFTGATLGLASRRELR